MAGQWDYDEMVKLLVLGDTSVGKSALLLRYCDGEFKESMTTTIGIDFKSKTVDHAGKKVKIQVWDTAGQERFRTIGPSYYRAAQGVIIAYDITNESSFQSVEEWLRQISEQCDSGVQKVLVGNKSDLSSRREVTTEQGRNLAQRHGVDFFEMSAKTGDGVDDAFLSLLGSIVRSDRPSQARNSMPLSRPSTTEEKKKCCGGSS